MEIEINCQEELFDKARFEPIFKPVNLNMHTVLPFFGPVSVNQINIPVSFRYKQLAGWDKFDSWTATHLLGGCLGSITYDARESPNLVALQDRAYGEKKIALLEILPFAFQGQSFQYVLVPIDRRFLLYFLKSPLPGQELLQHNRLALLLGIENTVVRVYDLDKKRPPQREELAMLETFHRSNKVDLPGKFVF